MLSKPGLLLHFEGAFVVVLGVLLYDRLGANWKHLAFLYLAPDLALLGCLGGVRLGATLYNLPHPYTGPLLLAAGSMLAGRPDRALGFGLKYPTYFKDSHMLRVKS